MRAVRDEHDFSLRLAAGPEAGGDHLDSAEFRLRAGRRRKRSGRHAADFAENCLHFVEDTIVPNDGRTPETPSLPCRSFYQRLLNLCKKGQRVEGQRGQDGQGGRGAPPPVLPDFGINLCRQKIFFLNLS